MTTTEEALAGARALVTGASGFIGSRLCRRLAAAGAEVHGVSRRRAEGEGVGRWWRGELTEPQWSAELIASAAPDYIFHLAGFVSGARELEAVRPAFEGNLLATLNLLTAVAERGCRRFVLAGSLEEPDPGPGLPVPASPYAASKFAATTYARFFHALYGLPTAVARIFMVYGPEQKDLAKLVPYVALSLLRGEPPSLSSGARQVDWIFVDDVVEGLIRLALAEGAAGKTVDLGSGELVTIREVVELLHEIVGSEAAPRFGALADRPLEQVRVAAVEDSFAAIGWRPQVPLREGLERTVAWYQDDLTGRKRARNSGPKRRQ